MHLDRSSLILGALGATAVLVSFAAIGSPGPPRIEYGPNPRDMVVIRQGTPFVVPPGKLFVLTGLGATSYGSQGILRVDGQLEYIGGEFTGVSTGEVVSVNPFPAGYTLPSGSTIEPIAQGGPSPGRAWGYLANQP